MNIEIELWHPKLKGKNYKIINTNKILNDFNCISYTLDIYNEWYGSNTSSWPDKTISRIPKLENYIKYYNSFGYEICDNDKYEDGFEKIAIYINKNS
jgi:hypothetical protein